jgi:hypothetical protein
MARNQSTNSAERKSIKKMPKMASKSKAKGLKPISLNPLGFEQAIQAAIATGPITDSRIKKRRDRGSIELRV